MPCKPGDRIELIFMPDDPDPIPAGQQGTVTNVSLLTWGPDQIYVTWDDPKRSLMLLEGVDHYKVIGRVDAPG